MNVNHNPSEPIPSVFENIVRAASQGKDIGEHITPAVIETFRHLAEQNPQFVEKSHAFQYIKRVLENPERESSADQGGDTAPQIQRQHELISTIQRVVSLDIPNPLRDLEHIILNDPSGLSKYIKKNPLSVSDVCYLIFEHEKVGTIKDQQVLEFLSLKGKDQRLLLNADLTELVPLLKKLAVSNADAVKELLSTLDRKLRPLLESNLTKLLPVLEILAESRPDAFKELLSMLDRKGRTLLESNLTKLLPILEILAVSNADAVIKLLSIQDKRGLIPLHYDATVLLPMTTKFGWIFLQHVDC